MSITYEIECEQDQSDFRGHFASGEDELDRALEAEIAKRLDRGDIWAWCCVRVVAIADNGDRAYSDWLGGCCYGSEADYRTNSGYFTDQCAEARANLCTVEQSHRQGIQTRYFGPTNTKGARVKVWAQAGARYISWDHALNADANHAAACQKFADEWGWTGRWIGGQMPDGKGYLFVNLPTK